MTDTGNGSDAGKNSETSIAAFIIAGNHVADLSPLTSDYAGCMVPLLDRPWLQHMVELFVTMGIRRIHMFISDQPQQIESHFEDGRRWGVEIIYHLGADEQALFRQIKVQCGLIKEENILLCQANSIFTDFPELNTHAAGHCLMIFPSDDGSAEHNWYLMQTQAIADLSVATSYSQIAGLVNRHFKAPLLQVHHAKSFLRLDNLKDLVEAQRQVLQGFFPQLLCNANEAEPGIRISRNVTLSPGVKISAPVFIGENCQVGDRVQLGPNAVIGANCIIDGLSTFEDAVVFSGSYIGEGLNVKNSVINHNRLINLDIGGEVFLAEDFILGSLSDNWFLDKIFSWFSRFLALVMFVALLPLFAGITMFLLLIKGRSNLFRVRECVKTPQLADGAAIQTFRLLSFSGENADERRRPYYPAAHFCLEFLPGLLAVIRGDLDLSGLPARTYNQFSALSQQHQKLFLKGRSGLVSERQVFWSSCCSKDENELADTHQLARRSFWYDLKLLGRYFLSLLNLPR